MMIFPDEDCADLEKAGRLDSIRRYRTQQQKTLYRHAVYFACQHNPERIEKAIMDAENSLIDSGYYGADEDK